ncbi:MAG: phosphotransferase [Bacteroidia bacterium]|nr:phosphotransferase [Bacteroidia bacterium]
MNQAQIYQLIAGNTFPDTTRNPELMETHISWVILTDHYAFKIKKPVKYSFLDFSTLKNRAYFTRRELLLNSRFSEGVYLKRLPVWEYKGKVSLEENGGEIIDWAIMMRRMNKEKQMNNMLKEGQVTPKHIEELAERLADFHRNAKIIFLPQSLYNLKQNFNDILTTRELAEVVSPEVAQTIDRAVYVSNRFLLGHQQDFRKRVERGFVRDCHGDLHTGNIFLESPPVIFDCIEFNDEWRHADVLDDLAFLCMDIEAAGGEDLSEIFLQKYLQRFPCITTPSDVAILTYYKLYRANVRMKVTLLEMAKNTLSAQEIETHKNRIKKYSELINHYITQLATPSVIGVTVS